MSGLIAVLGGQEHHPGCEPIDRRLLAESGLSHPTVTVLLAATVPNRIRAKILEATNYWPGLGARVRELSRDGVPLSGSSAGAMALCTWRLHLQPGVTPRIERGLGFVPGLAAPHYGRHATHHACRAIAFLHPHMDILGLQDRTALVGRDGHYQVMGAGWCTIVRDATRRSYRSGAEVRLAGAPRLVPATGAQRLVEPRPAKLSWP